MSLSRNTLAILRSFAQINQGIVFQPGNELRTMGVMRNIFADAKIQETFPFEIAIYDLLEFLKVYKTGSHLFFDEEKEAMIIRSGDDETTYLSSNPAVIVSPGEKRVRLLEGENHTKFILGKEPLKQILKIRSRIKLKYLLVRDKEFVMSSYNKNPVITLEHPFMDYGGQESLLHLDHLRCLMPLDYDVEISPKGVARFISRNSRYKITYYIALEDGDVRALLDKRWVGLGRKPRKKPKITKKKFKNGEEQHFDEYENLIYFKGSNGQKQWYEYDDRDNLIHYKTSSGFEKWYVYDEEDNLVKSWTNKDLIAENEVN